MTAIPSNPTLRPFWVAISFVNFTAALPMIELDLRRVDGTSPHHAESIACHALLAEIGRDQAHIICALGKAAGADVPRISLPPASGNNAPPPPPGLGSNTPLPPAGREGLSPRTPARPKQGATPPKEKSTASPREVPPTPTQEVVPPFREEKSPALSGEIPPTPLQRADTLAQARLEVAGLRRDLLKGVPVDVQFTAPTLHKLKAALEQANFDPTLTELWNVATILLGRVVNDTYPLKEADARAVLAFLERASPERLDILFPVMPLQEAG
jgi:hypothetical protein